MNNYHINYVKGDATEPSGIGTKIICHICNDIGAWGKGFVLAVSQKWPVARERYLELYKSTNGRRMVLGDIQVIPIRTDDIVIVNMIAQSGIANNVTSKPIRYGALNECLYKVNKLYQELSLPKSIHMPRIGTGLAGGAWDVVEDLIVWNLCRYNIPVTVYDK